MFTSALAPLRIAARAVRSVRRIGVGNAIGTAHEVFWGRIVSRFSRPRLILHHRIRGFRASHGDVVPRKLSDDWVAVLRRGQSGYRAGTERLGLSGAKAAELNAASDFVIGEIDQDGFLRSDIGDLNDIPTVSPEEFGPRHRFGLTLHAQNGVLVVRKDYRGDQNALLREAHALDTLAQSGCNVPALLAIDFEKSSISMSYIPGTVLREGLASRGAVVRDRDIALSGLSALPADELHLARIREGRNELLAVVDPEFVEELFRQLRIMHAARFIWGDIKYGNVIIEDQSSQPYLIDFESASFHGGLEEYAFRHLADSDIENFNLHFGTNKLTLTTLREQAAAIPASDVYAPACFAAGISIGNVWDNSNGYGRWRFLLRDALPPLEGARVLDLGANNGFNSMQLLRNGASEVVAVELDDAYFEQGKFLHAAFEYGDCESYRLRYLHANMKDIITKDLGRFDFVMALCSIYYLDDDEIASVARHVSTIADTLVLQCNTEEEIGRSDSHTYVKASVDYARKILTDAGFSNIKIVAPEGYSRPLVIGHHAR